MGTDGEILRLTERKFYHLLPSGQCFCVSPRVSPLSASRRILPRERFVQPNRMEDRSRRLNVCSAFESHCLWDPCPLKSDPVHPFLQEDSMTIFPPGDTLLTLQEVSSRTRDTSLLRDITFSVHAGELMTLIGPNGAGKSTLLKIILGLWTPSGGTVRRASSLRSGYMPQKLEINTLLPLTVERFLALTFEAVVTPSEALSRVSALRLKERSLHHLSGGELQRVLLAKALMRDPHLLILDEPTQGLDIDGQRQFYGLLDQLKRENPSLTILLASHDLYMVFRQSTQVVCLNHHVCCIGTPDTVEKHPDYLRLFGQDASPDLAPYTHIHSHCHDPLDCP